MKLKTIFLILAIVFLAIGFSSMFMSHGRSSTLDMVQGVAKGLAGVSFILFYVLTLFGKEPMDKTGADHW